MIMPILAVSDLTRSIGYYRDQLGFELNATMRGPDGQEVFGLVTHGPGVMLGLSLQPVEGPRGQGMVLMLYVPEGTDIDAYHDLVASRGVSIAEGLIDQYWGDRTFAVVDPDGFYLMFSKSMRVMTAEEIEAAQSAN